MERPSGSRRIATFVILLTVFVDILGFGIILPLLPLYARDFGATDTTIGLLMASSSGMQFLFSPFWGRVSDRFGRKPVVLLTLVGSTLSYALFGWARSLPLLFVARMLVGITGATISVGQAYMADLSKPEDRAHAMGMVGAALGVGFVFGPALGGLLVPLGHGAPGYAASGIAFVGLILALIYLPESRPAPQTLASPVRAASRWKAMAANRDLAVLVVFFFCLNAAGSNVYSMYALWMHDRLGFGPTQVGYTFAVFGLLTAVTQGLIVRPVVRRLGERGALTLAIGLLLVGYAVTTQIYTVQLLLITLVCQALGGGLANPSLISLISREAAQGEQGFVLGINQSAGGLARVFGPLWGGFIFHRVGPSGPFATAATLCAVLFAGAFLLRKTSPAPRPRETIGGP